MFTLLHKHIRWGKVVAFEVEPRVAFIFLDFPFLLYFIMSNSSLGVPFRKEKIKRQKQAVMHKTSTIIKLPPTSVKGYTKIARSNYQILNFPLS